PIVRPPSPKQMRYLADVARVASMYDEASRNVGYSDKSRLLCLEMASNLIALTTKLLHPDAPQID
ncbi:MAG TPA: hypothetical protein VF132_13550, partial [Rudaea sp.]